MSDMGRRTTGPETTIPSLTRWGLSPSAELVYRALSILGQSTIEELCVGLDLPVRRVQDALEELRAIGGCGLVDGLSPARWSAGAPSAVTAALQRRHQQMAVSAHALRQQMMTRPGGLALDEGDLSAAFGTTIRPLFGSPRVRGRLGELIAAERSEYLAMIPEPAIDQESVKAAAPLNRALCRRGQVFSLGVPAAVDDQSGGHTQELIAMGMFYREQPVLPTKLFVIDRATALTPIDPTDPAKGYWEITTPEVVHRLVELYMQRWQQAEAPQKRWTPPMTLTPRERAVLSLLAEGHTDEAVAALLGISRRTIAYTVADLMERHGARTRFQLGLFLSDLDTPAPAEDVNPPTELALEDQGES